MDQQSTERSVHTDHPVAALTARSTKDIRTTATLAREWAATATQLKRFGAAEIAKAVEECARQLRDALDSEGDSLLSLAEAAAISGYSVDHLSRLIRSGVIPNRGRKGKPSIARKDLPLRPTSPRSQPARYDPVSDARSLGIRGEER